MSKSLVSLVFADPAAVSDERRRRVLAAAEELGFRPNQAARSLAAATGGFVGIVVADLRNPVFADIVDAARAALLDRGAVALVTTVAHPREAAFGPTRSRGPDLFGDLRPSGLLLAGSVPDAPLVAGSAPGRPLVLASAVADGLPGASTVRSDDVAGMRLLVDHLVRRGHRDIAHVGGKGGPEARLRAAAYVRAMQAHGLGARTRVVACDYSPGSGRAATERLLADPAPPTAITAVNDLAAAGAVSALHDAGRRMAVTGYDGTFLGELSPLSLTTIDPHGDRIGASAARLLLAAGPPTEVLVPPTLVVRGSTS